MIWMRCPEMMFAGTVQVVVPELVPEAPAWLDPDSAEAPAWPSGSRTCRLSPTACLCEPEPVAGAPAVGRVAPPDEAPPPLWLDMPPPPEAEGDSRRRRSLRHRSSCRRAPPLGDAAAPLPPLDPTAPLPLLLVCTKPAATLKAKAATAAVLNDPWRPGRPPVCRNRPPLEASQTRDDAESSLAMRIAFTPKSFVRQRLTSCCGTQRAGKAPRFGRPGVGNRRGSGRSGRWTGRE